MAKAVNDLGSYQIAQVFPVDAGAPEAWRGVAITRPILALTAAPGCVVRISFEGEQAEDGVRIISARVVFETE